MRLVYSIFGMAIHGIIDHWTILPVLVLIFIASPKLHLFYLIEESFGVIFLFNYWTNIFNLHEMLFILTL